MSDDSDSPVSLCLHPADHARLVAAFGAATTSPGPPPCHAGDMVVRLDAADARLLSQTIAIALHGKVT